MKKSNRTRRNRQSRVLGEQFENLEDRRLMAADFGVDHSANLSSQMDATPAAFASFETVESDLAQVQNTEAVSEVSSQLMDEMRAQVESTGRLALNAFDELATFAGITIEAPAVGNDSVTGTTSFGTGQSPVLLQYVPQTGKWLLAVKSELGELIPTDSPIESPFELESPIFVFSAGDAELSSDEMSPETATFYRQLYQREDFEVRVEKGVNILTTATIKDDSIVSDLLENIGVDVPAVDLEGVVFGDFTPEAVNEFAESEKDKKFFDKFREDMLLRATLPQITVNGLPSNMAIGRASLVWQSPGTDHDWVYAALDMTIDDGDGMPTELTGRLGFMDTPTGSEFRLSANARNINDAFGITGLDLNDVTLLVAVDTVNKPSTTAPGNAVSDPTAAVPSASVGVSATMEIGDRDVMIAGKVDFALATGSPLKVALRGELSELSSNDLIGFANRLTGVEDFEPNNENLPEFVLKDLMINIAPLGGDVELGIEDGIGVRGALYLNDTLLGEVDGLIDRTDLIPKIQLKAYTREFELGDLSVSDVNIDVMMTQSVEDYFIVNGSVDFLGVSHAVDINIGPREMYYHITTEVDGLGMVDYEFHATTLGIPRWTFNATARNDLSKTLEEEVATDVRDWAEQASRDFDAAQADLDAAQRAVDQLKDERAAAIAEAQREFDAVEADLRSAQRAVDSLSSRVSSLRRSESRARGSWQAAVRSRRAAKWYQYPARRATEVARYSSYRSIQGARIAAQGSLRAASAVLGEVRDAAGWVLDAAGPESHPSVVAISAELAIKTAALDIAKAAVQAAEDVSTGAAGVVAFVAERHDDLFMIDEIRFSGTLSAAVIGSSFDFEIDYRLLEEADTFKINASTDVIEDLALELIDVAKEKLAS